MAVSPKPIAVLVFEPFFLDSVRRLFSRPETKSTCQVVSNYQDAATKVGMTLQAQRVGIASGFRDKRMCWCRPNNSVNITYPIQAKGLRATTAKQRITATGGHNRDAIEKLFVFIGPARK